MKNILLLVHNDEGQESRLQVAIDITRALGGHLECLDVMALPIIVADFQGSGAIADIRSQERQREAENRARIEARLASQDITWSIGDAFGTFADALTYASDLADLIIVSSRLEKEGGQTPAGHPERLPLKAERPILAVPPGCTGLNTGGKALIAWDGSRSCNEAVRAAVPLLRCASEVALLSVNQQQGALAMKDVAMYLSRHSIAAELVERSTDGRIADVIMAHARHRELEYIVMGAYSLPPAAQAVFGGVTRALLVESEVPLLLAH